MECRELSTTESGFNTWPRRCSVLLGRQTGVDKLIEGMDLLNPLFGLQIGQNFSVVVFFEGNSFSRSNSSGAHRADL